MTAPKQGIILDKSFLQGVPGRRIAELATSHQLVMCETTFYELITGDEPGRSRCFAKLGGSDPAALVSNIGPMMRFEIDTGRSAGRPSSRRFDAPFRFNPGLAMQTYVFPAEVQATIDEMTANLRRDVTGFIERVDVVPSFFSDLLAGSAHARNDAYRRAEQDIVAPRALIPFYSQLEPPPGEKALPSGETVSEEWALYRHLQMGMLLALDVYVRYQGRAPDISNPNIYERIEHDVLDAQITMLACLEGAFATRELKLKRWFQLARPDGLLIEQ